MAPELWRGSTISFDKTIDVYAFGMTALALLGVTPPNELRAHPPVSAPVGAVSGLLTGLPGGVATILEACLSHSPANRPQMSQVRDELARHLLFDKHRALLIISGQQHEINNNKRAASVRFGATTSIVISYDGYVFSVSQISGDVSANNKPLSVGSIINGCAVLTLVSTSSRGFVTFDVSNPEVMP